MPRQPFSLASFHDVLCPKDVEITLAVYIGEKIIKMLAANG